MNFRIVTVATVAAFTVASVSVLAQTTRVIPGGIQVVRPNVDPASQAERIAALESQVAQLNAQVKSLSVKLDQTNQTANQAYTKGGLSQIWIQSNGDGAVQATQWVNKNGGPVLMAANTVDQQSGQLNQILTVVTQNAQGIKDIDTRLYLTCREVSVHEGMQPMDALAHCRASGLDPSYVQLLARPFY